MIVIKNLSKRYRELKVLDQINLAIKDGEIYGLAGVSGVGKSTLLGCLNKMESYDQGSICIDGVKVEELKGKELREFRKNIGMIFQDFSLIGRKNIYQNIAFPLECWGYSKEEINKRVKELAALVGIEDKLKMRPRQLSGGQKQRAAIARALMLEPKYLLCDECTSSLDPRTTNSILELLKDLHDKLGITIIMVTHEMSVIRKACDKIAILENGRVVVDGNVEGIFKMQPEALLSLTGEERKTYLGKSDNLIKIDESNLEAVTAYLAEQNISYQKINKEDILC